MSIPQITFTRFLAAIGIVIFHFGRSIYPFNTEILNRLFTHANMGVSYFFVLSGFILTVVYYQENGLVNKRNFWAARLARIYPIYFFALVIFLIHPLIFNPNSLETLPVTLHTFLLEAWHPKYPITLNFPGWSLSVEAFFYLLFPLILWLMARLSKVKIILVMISTWLVSSILHILLITQAPNSTSELIHNFIFYNPLLHLGTFVVGACGGLLFLKRPGVHLGWKAPALVAAALGLTIAVVLIPNPLAGFLHNGLLSPLFLLIILGLAWDRGSLGKIFAWQPLVFLGEASYGIYILQEPVRLWFYQFSGALGWLASFPALCFYLYLVILVGFSSLTFLLLEKPTRAFLKSKLIDRKSN